MVVLVGAFGLGIAALATAVRVIESGLPGVPTFAQYAGSVPKVSRVLASDGTVVAEFFIERRTVMDPESIPPLLEKAILAAEDAGFYEHEGLSYWGIARAMLVNLWKGRITQGGSTITQQVVKQVLLGPERTYERKVREMLLARQVERRLTKKEILAIYASEVYLGRGRYGFEEAARFYVNKPAASLNLAEAALLAGLVQAPEALNPIAHPEAALRRQHYVLERMVVEGLVSEEEAREAARATIRLWGREAPRIGAAPYFVDGVRREVTRLLGEGRLLHDGLTIETTLDLAVSDAAEVAVAWGLARLWGQGRTRVRDEESAQEVGGRGSGGSGKPNDPALADGTDDLLDGIPPPPRAVRAKVIGCDPARGVIEVEAGGERARLDPRSLARMALAGHPDLFATCRPGADLLASGTGGPRPEPGTLPVVHAEVGPQAAVAVVDPVDRAVLALVGGEDFATRPFNRAVQSRRPIGSAVKPFLYAAALESGMPATRTFPNTALHLRGAGGRPWVPRNFEGGWDGRDYDIGTALAQSINVIAVRTMLEIGPDPVADLLAALGFEGPIPRDLSLALGSAEASPLELANAMATFAAGGLYDTPFLVRRVTDREGRTLLEHDPRPSRRVSRATAQAIRAMMRRVVTEGTAREASSLPWPIFGKTGTSNRSREAWFVGSDGRLVAAFAVGYDDRLPMRGATGGNTAVPLFVAFLRALRGVDPSPSGGGPGRDASAGAPRPPRAERPAHRPRGASPGRGRGGRGTARQAGVTAARRRRPPCSGARRRTRSGRGRTPPPPARTGPDARRRPR